MIPNQFQRELDYGAGIAIAGHLLSSGLISTGEYRKVKAALTKKYRPAIGLLDEGPANIHPPPQKAIVH